MRNATTSEVCGWFHEYCIRLNVMQHLNWLVCRRQLSTSNKKLYPCCIAYFSYRKSHCFAAILECYCNADIIQKASFLKPKGAYSLVVQKQKWEVTTLTLYGKFKGRKEHLLIQLTIGYLIQIIKTIIINTPLFFKAAKSNHSLYVCMGFLCFYGLANWS